MPCKHVQHVKWQKIEVVRALNQKTKKNGMNLTKEIGEIHRKLSLLLTVKSQVDVLEGIAATVHAIERSMQEMSRKYDRCLPK